MRRLDDPILLAQCARIKAMIQEVANAPAHKDDYYAKLYHHWKLSPTVPLTEIEAFERRAGVTLPEGYVYYLTQVGGGGASPGTGFKDFAPNWKNYDGLCGVSEQLSRVMTSTEWSKAYGKREYVENGTFILCAMDITYQAYLIVTGPMRGHVVYLDWDGDCAPMWPKGGSAFLDWNENYYSELLAGYKIDPTWRFMWQEPGNTDSLIHAFQQAGDLEYKKDVILSFTKFEALSQTAQSFLAGVQEPELKNSITRVLEAFKQ